MDWNNLDTDAFYVLGLFQRFFDSSSSQRLQETIQALKEAIESLKTNKKLLEAPSGHSITRSLHQPKVQEELIEDWKNSFETLLDDLSGKLWNEYNIAKNTEFAGKSKQTRDDVIQHLNSIATRFLAGVKDNIEPAFLDGFRKTVDDRWLDTEIDWQIKTKPIIQKRLTEGKKAIEAQVKDFFSSLKRKFSISAIRRMVDGADLQKILENALRNMDEEFRIFMNLDRPGKFSKPKDGKLEPSYFQLRCRMVGLRNRFHRVDRVNDLVKNVIQSIGAQRGGGQQTIPQIVELLEFLEDMRKYFTQQLRTSQEKEKKEVRELGKSLARVWRRNRFSEQLISKTGEPLGLKLSLPPLCDDAVPHSVYRSPEQLRTMSSKVNFDKELPSKHFSSLSPSFSFSKKIYTLFAAFMRATGMMRKEPYLTQFYEMIAFEAEADLPLRSRISKEAAARAGDPLEAIPLLCSCFDVSIKLYYVCGSNDLQAILFHPPGGETNTEYYLLAYVGKEGEKNYFIPITQKKERPHAASVSDQRDQPLGIDSTIEYPSDESALTPTFASRPSGTEDLIGNLSKQLNNIRLWKHVSMKQRPGEQYYKLPGDKSIWVQDFQQLRKKYAIFDKYYQCIRLKTKHASSGEDACFVNPWGMGVFDGVGQGGAESGKFASTLCTETSRSICDDGHLLKDYRGCSAESILEGAVENVRKHGCCAESASSVATSLVLVREQLHAAWVGDSQWAILRWKVFGQSSGEGRFCVVYFSRPSYFHEPVDVGPIPIPGQFGVKHSFDYIKNKGVVKTDIIDLREGDLVIAASDGLWDNLGVSHTLAGDSKHVEDLRQALVRVINPPARVDRPDPMVIGRELQQAAVTRMNNPNVGKPDDMSIVVAQVSFTSTNHWKKKTKKVDTQLHYRMYETFTTEEVDLDENGTIEKEREEGRKRSRSGEGRKEGSKAVLFDKHIL